MSPVRTILWVGLLVALPFISVQALADGHAAPRKDANTQFEVRYNLLEAERRSIIANKIRFSTEESAQFWPIYDEYRRALKELERKRHALILDIAKNLQNPPDEVGEEMVDTAIGLHQAIKNNATEHFEELKGVISGAKLLRYFQIDVRLNSVFMYRLTKTIPLVSSENIKMFEQISEPEPSNSTNF